MVRREEGFTYVIAMFLVAILSVLGLHGLQVTLTKERRDKEAQLIEAGMAYRQAIFDYYENSPGTLKTYPPTLDALLLDNRTSTMRRHLRKRYRDPMTGDEFALLRNDDGGIQGVYSRSIRVPIKQAGFPDAMAASKNAKKYLDWQFSYIPTKAPASGERQ